MQRIYELMFIVRPDMVDEELDKLISTLETQVSTAGGTLKNAERMGKRRLAYMVRNFHDGMYVLFTIEGSGEIVARAGAPPARRRAGDQVHHRARGRRAEAPQQDQGPARRARQGASPLPRPRLQKLAAKPRPQPHKVSKFASLSVARTQTSDRDDLADAKL